MTNLNTKSVCFSHIGGRSNHEDNFLVGSAFLGAEQQRDMVHTRGLGFRYASSDRVQLFAVSDGMGGHKAGEVASRMVVTSLQQLNKDIQATASMEEAVQVLQQGIARINNEVKNAGLRSPDCQGMGATLVVFLIHGTDLAVLNVGDSRAYSFDGTQLVQITKDNTEGQRLLDLGLLTKEELISFPARKHLSRCMGHGQAGYVLNADVYRPQLNKGLLLLCSDGISDAVSQQELTSIITTENSLENAGKMILEKAVANPKADNATLIIISIGG